MSVGRHHGLLYRALNPVHAHEPLSGRGTALHGGRFNPKGVAALYTSLRIETAIRETNQIGTLQPTTVLAYEAAIENIFDTRDAPALAGHGMAPGDLADPAWRERMTRGRPVPTQDLAAALLRDGHAGLLVRSFAAGATEGSLNLVLWRWNTGQGDRLVPVDAEGRLSHS